MHGIMPYMLAVVVAIALAMASLDVRWTIRERLTRSVRRAIRRTRVRGAMFLAWALSPGALLRIAGIPAIAGADGTEINAVELRKALGISETADPVSAIANMQAEIVALRDTIAGNKPTAEAAEMARLRNDLAESKRQLIIEQSENARRIAAIEQEARRDKAIAKVERAIASGKPPVMREQLLEVAMMMTPDKFDEFLVTIPSIDMTERGVATGHELAELEPTASDYAVAKSMAIDTTSKEWRLGIMREKAKAKGLTLPAEVA